LFSLPSVHTGFGNHPALIRWALVLFVGAERPGCEADHQPLSSDEVNNEWSYTSIPPIYLHVEERENFTVTFTNTSNAIRSFILFTVHVSVWFNARR
jgi:hypothetical protein